MRSKEDKTIQENDTCSRRRTGHKLFCPLRGKITLDINADQINKGKPDKDSGDDGMMDNVGGPEEEMDVDFKLRSENVIIGP